MLVLGVRGGGGVLCIYHPRVVRPRVIRDISLQWTGVGGIICDNYGSFPLGETCSVFVLLLPVTICVIEAYYVFVLLLPVTICVIEAHYCVCITSTSDNMCCWSILLCRRIITLIFSGTA